MTTTKLKIAVVPEHFSIPFHLGLETGIYAREAIELEIEEYPRGTGSMCKALKEKKVDIAVALTEGLVADRVKEKSDFRIIATYVQSPLKWAAVAAPDSKIESLKDLKGKTFGISRFGSGSHIQSFVLASNEGWDVNTDLKFKVKGGLDDLLGGIKDGSTDTFLWETFMMKPYVLKNEVKYVGHVTTPWPCFMIAARNDVIKDKPEVLKKFLSATQEACRAFKKHKDSLTYIKKKCHLNDSDAKEWFDGVQFSEDGKVSKKVLELTMDVLLKVGAIKEKVDVKELVDENLTVMTD